MKILKRICLLCCFLLAFVSCVEKSVPLKVLQLNLWYQGNNVPGGFEAIVSTIDQTDPDVIFLCEVKSVENNPFVEDLKTALKKMGKEYFGEYVDMGVVVLSKYKLSDMHSPFTENKIGAKGKIEVAGHTIVLYSLHLDYLHYECYMPRGYNGFTWKKMKSPASNADSVLTANRLSKRDETIAAFIKDAREEISNGNMIVLGGDFNEPSHLDWQSDTKDLRDHNGLVINWDCSVMLQKEGYKDVYREIYPNPVTHPGFTFAAGNKDAKIKDLIWTEGVDDRDRIDFIYYLPEKNISLEDAMIVGPVEDLYKGRLVNGKAEDAILTLNGTWPTDHKGTLAIFKIDSK